jgi:hypothetical protein
MLGLLEDVGIWHELPRERPGVNLTHHKHSLESTLGEDGGSLLNSVILDVSSNLDDNFPGQVEAIVNSS